MANSYLSNAKNAKNDEFYTQYGDIEKEVNAYLEFDPDVFRGKTVLLPCDDPEWSNFTRYFAQNFERLGLAKLISTSYAPTAAAHQMTPTTLESDSPLFDPHKTTVNGKIFTLTRDVSADDRINIDDLEWQYLDGDGDFRSDEVSRLRDEADVIITNPPFSMFREFLAWIVQAEKKFVIIGSMNAITYLEVFRLIKNDRIWLGNGFRSGNAFFRPLTEREYSSGVFDAETKLVKFRNVVWFTNLDHGRRHSPLPLMTMADNVRFSRHREIRGRAGYEAYDNYDAIEVPFTDAIPGDYAGAMGVPISFLDKYSPDQFEILGMPENTDPDGLKTKVYSTAECQRAYVNKFGKPGTYDLNARGVVLRNGLMEKVYSRILIRHRRPVG